MAKHTKVVETDTGYDVHFGDDLVVGVHNNEASTEAQAIKVAEPQYDIYLESKENGATK